MCLFRWLYFHYFSIGLNYAGLVMQAFFHVMAIISGILTSLRAIRSLHLTTLLDVKMLQSTFPSRGRQPPRQTNIRARRALGTRWLRWFQFRKCSRRGYPGQQLHMTKKAISLIWKIHKSEALITSANARLDLAKWPSESSYFQLHVTSASQPVLLSHVPVTSTALIVSFFQSK